MANNEATTKFKVDISDLKKNIQEANRQIRLANAEFKAASAGMDNWSKSTYGLSAKIAQTEKVLKNQKTILADYEKQLALIVQEYGENSKEADEMRIKVENQKAAVAKSEKALADYNKQLAELESEQKAAAETAEKENTALEKLKQTIEDQEKSLSDLKEKYASVVLEQGKESDAAKELAGKIGELSGDLKDNKDKLNEASKAADDYDQSLEDASSGGISSFGIALGNLMSNVISSAISKLKDLVTETINVGKQFDSSMSQVAAVSGATGEELQALRDKAKEMGSTTQFTASEAADAFNYMAMAGWKTEEMIDGIPGVLNLAAASGTDLATTSDIVTDALTAMGYAAEDAGHLADVMAAASSNANTNVQMMGETFKYAAPVVGSLGYNMEDTAIAVGLMANSGIKASSAGTALRGTLSRLTKPTEEMEAVMVNLGLATQEATREIDNKKVQKAQEKLANSTSTLEKAQISYNAAVKKFGENSDQARKAQITLESAERKLASAKDDLAKAQEGELKLVTKSIDVLTDEKGEMRSLMDVMKLLREKMGGLSEAEQAQAAATLFGQEAMSGMLAIINASPKDFSKLTEAVYNSGFSIDSVNESLKNSGIEWEKYGDKAWTADGAIDNLASEILYNVNQIGTSTEDLRDYLESEYDLNADDAIKAIEAVTSAMESSEGAAESMAKTMQNNLGGDMAKLSSQFEGVQLAIYEKLEPALRAGISILSGLLDGVKWLVDHGDEVSAVLSGIAAAVGAYLAYTTAVTVMTKGWAALTVVTKAQAAAQAALNVVMNMNPIGLIVSAIAALVAAFTVLWNKSEEFRNFWKNLWKSIQEAAENVIEAVVGFFRGAWDKIKAVWSDVTGFFTGIWDAIQDAAESLIEGIVNFFTSAWKTIKAVWDAVVGFFQGVWDGIKSAAQAAWDFIASVWQAVSSWFRDNVVQPVQNFFAALWDGIKNASSSAWNGIKNIWEVVSGWFKNTIIQPVQNFFTGMWDGLKNGAKNAWEGIKSVFSHISDWFKDKFSKAWQAVKDVFSTGGKIFDGIKDGIVTAFKAVVNAIIRGINKVVAMPIEGINWVLDKIKNVSIFGLKPFDFISLIPVPEIPELKQGGVLKRGQMGFLEGDGAEAVVPLENNKRWIAATAQELKRALALEGLLGTSTVSSSSVTNNYNFTQNNTSPKALSRLEIYRQSKNLFAMRGAM